MTITGHIRKMVTSPATPVQYLLPLDNEQILLNDYIGKLISLRYSGEIHCVACGRRTNKSFNQGYCYPCFQSLAACDLCIVKPETCHYHLGTCREPQWGETHCMQSHYVYLANSSGLKVGITRGSQLPVRWIDQGASQALSIFRVSHRLLSGKIEVAIKTHVSDRTDWRKMLQSKPEELDLVQKRDELLSAARDELKPVLDEYDADVEFLGEERQMCLEYPVLAYPDKVKSLNFDKMPVFEGVLQGIKGQYLILDTGVMNMRKFAGYRVSFACIQE